MKKCQKCLAVGHYTYECKNQPKFLYRPTRTKMMKDKSLSSKPALEG